MKSTYHDRLTEMPLPDISLTANGRANHRAEVVSYDDDRRTRGLRALTEIAGEPGAAVVQGLRDIAPDLADWIIDFSYGDVMARTGLDRRSRQLATHRA